MKSSKKVLAFALAAAMVVTAVPATNAQAATTTAKLSATKVTVAAGTAKKQAKNIVVTIPSTWKSYKVTTSSSNKSVATARMCGKRTVKVTAVKKGSAKVTVKVTAKKSGKKVSKTLYANAKVIGAGLRFTSAPTDLAVGTEDKVVTKKCPSVAKVTYKSSDDAVATVDANDGTVKAIKAGKVTITATSDYGNIVTTDINVKKAILKSATQTEYNKIEAVIVGDTKDIKPSDITVTNTATKANVAVKSVSAKKGAENTFVIETFTSMTDAKEYSVVYADSTAVFTATNNTVAKVDLTKTEVPAGVKTEVKAVTKDANNIILGYFDLTNGNTSKGQVTTALTITKGYVQGTDVYLPTVGDTMAAKITYHTGSFASNGTETGVIENVATITAVDPSTINYNYAVTIGDSAPSWKAASFKANTAVKIGGQTKAYFRITDENGNDVADYSAYSVETADPTKLEMGNQEEMKRQQALAEEAYEDLAESLRYHLRIANTAVEYYQNQVKQEFVGNVYLVGDGSRFAGMHKLFAQELPLPLQEIDFTKVIDLRSGKNKAAEGTVTPDAASSGTRPKAATAVGFLSVIGAAVHPIDARPKDMLVADSKKNDLHTAYVILAGAVLVSVLLILGSGVRQLLAYREHRNLTKRINDLSYVQETYDDYARVQAEEQVYEKLDLATITKNEQLYPLIAQLENELPTTIHVKNIQTDGSLVTLNMEADRKVTVGQMLLNFADVTLLENLSIPSMSEESDEDSGTVKWTYTLNAYYTGAFLGEDGHLIKEAVPSADADADTDSMEGEEQTNE